MATEGTLNLRIEPEISGADIVLAGNFNPVIFTPAWFALHELLPESAARLEVAHQHATALDTDWMRLNVTLERFHMTTAQAPYTRICDLVLRVFKEQLPHTPVSALGINRNVHFHVDSFLIRDRIGRTLAPVEPWGRWAKDLGLDGEHGGMSSLTMSQIDPEDRLKGGRVNVTVEPSKRVGSGRTGVYVSVNDHYQIDHSDPRSCEVSMKYLEENFENSMRRSADIIDHVMSLAKK